MPDVIVLGTDVDGLVAAIAAHDQAADVTIFDTSDLLGGTTAMSDNGLVFGHAHKQRYDVAFTPADNETPGWIATGDTIHDLAAAIDVDPTALVSTVDRFNKRTTTGHDPDFRRGESAYDTLNGDQTLSGIEATLGPLTTEPFQAIKIEQGSLGTNGEPKTDGPCRVLARRDGVIEGLWAAGNVMAAPRGLVCSGAGGTIGPALTFG
jgi:predicted oxidoreductase